MVFDTNNPWMYTTIVLAVVVVASMYVNFSLSANVIAALKNGLPSGNAPANPSPQPSGNRPSAPVIDMKALADDDPVLGDPNAKVTIIAFEDFQCPFCERFDTQTFPQLKSQYIDTGKAKFIFRDFPLSFHQNADNAANVAECANEQGKFWQMHDKLFGNNAALNPNDGSVIANSVYEGWAKDLGLDASKFKTCLDSKKYEAEVQKDLLDGEAAGVSGTPSFFINGQQLVGAQPFSAFKSVIDAA